MGLFKHSTNDMEHVNKEDKRQKPDQVENRSTNKQEMSVCMLTLMLAQVTGFCSVLNFSPCGLSGSQMCL